jgi:hypothetical protein
MVLYSEAFQIKSEAPAHRQAKFEMRLNGYQNIRLSGGGYQDIGTTNSRRVSFLLFLMSWSSDILYPAFPVT